MKYGISFLLVAVLLLMTALQGGVWFYVLLYPVLSFAIVAIGYLGAGPRVFGKRSNGKRSWIATLLLLPYLLFTLSAWHLVRMVSRERAVDQVNDDLFLSRRLLTGEVPSAVNSIVDLTCEFTEDLSGSANYLCFPMLDASCPRAEELSELAMKILDLPKPVLIHCAQGHGRTGLVAAAVLLASNQATTADEALAMLQAVRPGIQLNAQQRKTLDRLNHS